MPQIIDQQGTPYPAETIRLGGGLRASVAADATVLLDAVSLLGEESALRLDDIAGTLNANKLYGAAALDSVTVSGGAGVLLDGNNNFIGGISTVEDFNTNGPVNINFPGGGVSGSAPISTNGGGMVTNLNAHRVGGYAASEIGTLADAHTWALSQILSAAASFQSPTVPFVVVGTDRVDNLTAQYLGAVSQDDAFFRNASNLNAGTVPDLRLSANVALTTLGNVFQLPQVVDRTTSTQNVLIFRIASTDKFFMTAGGEMGIRFTPGGAVTTRLGEVASGKFGLIVGTHIRAPALEIGSTPLEVISSARVIQGANVTWGGAFTHTGATAGVLGATPAARQTVSGSRGGNAALASVLTALATFGWITDSSTA